MSKKCSKNKAMNPLKPKKKRLINKEIKNINNKVIKYFNFKNIVEFISLFLNQNTPPLKAAHKLWIPEEK